MNFNFQLEENDVLQNFLDTELLNFPTFTEKLNKISKKKKPLVSGIEFIVRPECNQRCEYCMEKNFIQKKKEQIIKQF